MIRGLTSLIFRSLPCAAGWKSLLFLALLATALPGHAATALPEVWAPNAPGGHAYIIGLVEGKDERFMMLTTNEVWEASFVMPTTFIKVFDPTIARARMFEESTAFYAAESDLYYYTGGIFDSRIYEYKRDFGITAQGGLLNFFALPGGIVVEDGLLYASSSTEVNVFSVDPLVDQNPTLQFGGGVLQNAGPMALGEASSSLHVLDAGQGKVFTFAIEADPVNGVAVGDLLSSFSLVEDAANSDLLYANGRIFTLNGLGGGRVYDVATGTELAEFSASSLPHPAGNGGKAVMTLSPDGSTLYTWDPAADMTGYDLTGIGGPGPIYNTGVVSTLPTFSGSGILSILGDGGTLTLTGSGVFDGRINLYDNNTLVISRTASLDVHSVRILGGEEPGELVLEGDAESRGVLSTGDILSAGTLRFDGGILRSRQDGEVLVPVAISDGGAFLDSKGHDLIVRGPIGGGGSLTKEGDGRVLLAGTNSWTGGTVVREGTLQFATPGALPDANFTVESGAALVFSLGGAGEFTATEIVGVLAGAASPGFLDGSRLGLDSSNALGGSVTFSGNLGGLNGGGNALSLSKLGAGELVLSGSNSYTGGTRVDEGTARFATRASLPDNNLTVASDATAILQVGGAGEFAQADIIALAVGTGDTGFLDGARLGLDTSHAVGGAFAFSADLSDPDGGANALTLLKLGEGILVLSGSNSHSGGTVITRGSIQFSELHNLGAGPVTLDGGGLRWAAGSTLDISDRLNPLGAGDGAFDTNGNAVSLGSVLAGSGSLLKVGLGTLTLNAANTYDGGTIITGGFVQFFDLANLGTGGITLAGGGGLRWAAGSEAEIAGRTFTLAWGAGILDTNGNDVTVSARLTGGGVLVKEGEGTLTLTGHNAHGGGTVLNSGRLQLGTDQALGNGAFTINGGEARASGGEREIANALVLNGDFTLGREMFFSGPVTLMNDITITSANPDSQASAISTIYGTISGNHRLTFTDGVNPIGTIFLIGNNTYSGGTVLNSGVLALASDTALGTGMVTINGGEIRAEYLFIPGRPDWDPATNLGNDLMIQDDFGLGSGLNLTGALTLANDITITLSPPSEDGPTTTLLSGDISGGHSLAFSQNTSDALTVVLSGSNSYTGGTLIDGGVVRFTARTSLPDNNLTVGSDTTVILQAGGEGEFTGADIQALAVGTATTGFLNGSRLALDTNHATGGLFIFSGNLANPNGGANALGLLKLGAGTLVLSGSNSHSGGTVVRAGRLTITSAASLGDPVGTLTLDGGALNTAADIISDRSVVLGGGGGTFEQGGGYLTLTQAIDGTGGLTKTGSNYLTLTGAQTYLGTTDIQGGIFKVENGSLASSSITIASNAMLLFSTNGRYAKAVSGQGVLRREGGGTTILTGSATHTGGTFIDSGTLQIGDGGASGSVAGDITNNAALAFNRSDALAYGGVISGTGTVVQQGPGLTRFTATSTYTGSTMISDGTLVVNGSIASSALTTVASGGTLAGSGTVGELLVADGGTLSPGNSPGTLDAGNTIWNADGIYLWEINDAEGAKGGDPGTDWLNINGTLTIAATTDDRFTISITSLLPSNTAGPAANFDLDQPYTFVIATASGGISGFAADKFLIDTSAFLNDAANPRGFVISQLGNDILLTYPAVPEPSVCTLLSVALFATALLRRRKRREEG